MYITNLKEAKTLQLSNDAFMYLLAEELPLDDANMQEALEVAAMFPDGFTISDDWSYIEDEPGMVEATFIPYSRDTFDYDEYENLSKTCQLQIKHTEPGRIDVWRYSALKGEREYLGNFMVFTNQHGLKCFNVGGDWRKGKGSLFFLKHFKKKSE